MKKWIFMLLLAGSIQGVYAQKTEKKDKFNPNTPLFEGLSLKPWGIALKFLFLHHENILFPNDCSCCFFKLVLAFRNP